MDVYSGNEVHLFYKSKRYISGSNYNRIKATSSGSLFERINTQFSSGV